jgi:beta-phosphoglucomutase-like phosphatase (HAD superfamily)
VKAFDGMADCLSVLKNNFRLAVVTGSERATVESFMNQFFPGIFDVVVSGEERLSEKSSSMKIRSNYSNNS